MSKTYTITLTDAQDKALSVIAVNPQEWIENAILHRADISIDEIVAAEVERKLAANETISGTKEDIVLAADIKTAAQKQAEYDSEAANRIAGE